VSVVVLTMIFRRWRHPLVFRGSLSFLEFAGTWIYFQLSRPRPHAVPIVASWACPPRPGPGCVHIIGFFNAALKSFP
jgi:hypothetical protein